MHLLADVTRALEEDIGSGDVTAALIPSELQVLAVILSREPMLVCGRPWVDSVFSEVDKRIQVDWLVDEGSWQDAPTTLCEIRGSARSILTAERTAMNFLQTLSGTATTTHHYLTHLQGYTTRLLDTRKTLPGLRYAQKYAVACAGATNHRFGLYDAYLIKENHIVACGSIAIAIARARVLHPDLLVEVEVENLEELREALDSAPDRIMLDNFSLDMIKAAVLMNQSYKTALEVSGGIDLTTIASIAQTGVDYVSVGSITKSVQAIDLSLLIRDRYE